MGFVSALWSWQGEGLVYACWSALVPNHHAKSLSCFFAIGKETAESKFLLGWVQTLCLYETLQFCRFQTYPHCLQHQADLIVKQKLVLHVYRSVWKFEVWKEKVTKRQTEKKQFQLSSCLTSHESPQGLSPCPLSLLPTSLDSCFLSKETGNIDEYHFTSTLSFSRHECAWWLSLGARSTGHL